MDAATFAMIALPPAELSECRFVSLREATDLLDPRVARRLVAVLADPLPTSVYLENQRPPD